MRDFLNFLHFYCLAVIYRPLRMLRIPIIFTIGFWTPNLLFWAVNGTPPKPIVIGGYLFLSTVLLCLELGLGYHRWNDSARRVVERLTRP